MDRLRRHVPISKRYKLGVDEDVFINLELGSTKKNLIEYDRDNVISVDEVFNEERRNSKKYRFAGRLNLITANELSPDALNEDWDFLFDGNPALMPNNWLIQMTYPVEHDSEFEIVSRLDTGLRTNQANKGPQIKEIVPVTLNGQEPKAGIVGVQNHNLVVGDYVYIYNSSSNNPYEGIYEVISLGTDSTDVDKSFVINKPYIFNSFGNYRKILNPSTQDEKYSDSFDVLNMTSTGISGGTTGSFLPNETIYTTIRTVNPHGVFKGGFVDLRNAMSLNGIYEVENVLDDYEFVIKLTLSTNKGQQTNFSIPRPKIRTLNGTPSEYYVRYFEVITTNKYETYKCGFSSSIYPDSIVNEFGKGNQTWLFHFNEDVDLSKYRDNRGSEISEVFLSIIKRSGENTYNWSNVVADWDYNRLTIDNNNNIETISKNISGNVGSVEKINKGDRYVGDYVEYNRLELKEKVISNIVHRFGLQSNPNGEGYYYQPFRNFRLKVYSDNIETAEPNEEIIGIPNNFEEYPDGSLAWRDLLDVGVFEPTNNERVNYPFVNGSHYYYKNHLLYVRRQEPIDLIDQSNLITIEPKNLCQ